MDYAGYNPQALAAIEERIRRMQQIEAEQAGMDPMGRPTGRIRQGLDLADAGGPAMPEPRPVEDIASDYMQGAADLSGYTLGKEGIANIQRGYNEGDLLRGAGGAGQLAVAALPAGLAFKGGRMALNAATSSGPRMALMSGGMAVPNAMVASSEALAQSASPPTLGTTDEEAIRKIWNGMSPDQRKGYQSSIGVNPDGKLGPGTMGRIIAHETAVKEKAATESEARNARASETARIEAQAKADAIREQERANLARSERETNAVTPTRKLAPWLMPFLAPAAAVAGGMVGYGLTRPFARGYANEMNSLADRWKTAATGSTANPKLAKNLQDALAARKDEGVGGLGLPATALASGIAGAHIAAAPEITDVVRGVPDANEAFMSPEFGWRVGTEAVGAGLAGWLGRDMALAGARKRMPKNLYDGETEYLNRPEVSSSIYKSTQSVPAKRGKKGQTPSYPPPIATGEAGQGGAGQLSGSAGQKPQQGPNQRRVNRAATLSQKEQEAFRSSFLKNPAASFDDVVAGSKLQPSDMTAARQYYGTLQGIAKETGAKTPTEQGRRMTGLLNQGAKFGVPAAMGANAALSAATSDKADARTLEKTYKKQGMSEMQAFVQARIDLGYEDKDITKKWLSRKARRQFANDLVNRLDRDEITGRFKPTGR